MSEQKIPIPAMLYNAAVGGHVTNSQQIIDENLNREQNDINQETVGAVPYNSITPNGMGRIVLKKTDNFKTVVEAQTDGNTIFIIKYDFTLTGNVTIPANCILEFDGGSISNTIGNTYSIKGMFSINDVMYKIFNNITFVKDETIIKCDGFRPEWFGAKGDYNPSDGTGTDDSDAITEAIDKACITSVNKVKFASAIYKITKGIEISRGDIYLEGVQATLRETLDFSHLGYNNVNHHKRSVLYAVNCNNVITFTSTVTHPIEIRHLSFYNTRTRIGNAIKFASEFEGTTWPFVVTQCHFYNFDRAISFDTPVIYCVSWVKISENGFYQNNYCVCFENRNTDSAEHRNLTWKFIFTNNCAHHNVHELQVGCLWGLCEISGNNMEGNEAGGGEWLNDIMLGGNSTFIFTCNHFEQTTKKILRAEVVHNKASMRIAGNTIMATDAQYQVFNISTNLYGTYNMCSATIYSETPITVTNPNSSLRINCENEFDIIGNTATNAFIVAYKQVKKNINPSVVTPISRIIGTTTATYKACGTSIYRKFITDYTGISQLVPIENKSNFFVVSCISKDGNIPDVGLFNSGTGIWRTQGIGGQDYNFPFVFAVLPFNDTINCNQIYTFAADILSSHCECFTIVSDGDVSKGLYTNEHNILPDTSVLSSITNVLMGTQVFIGSKQYYYNGTAWVDATGTTV